MNFNLPFGIEDWIFQISQPVVTPQHQRRDFWGDVMLEVVDRMGKTQDFNNLLNELYEINDEFKLKPDKRYTSHEISDSALQSLFGSEHGWEWFKQHGFISWPKKVEEAYWRYFVDCRVPVYLEFLIDMGERVNEIAKKTGLDLDLTQYTPLISWFPCSIHRVSDPAYDLHCFSYRDVLHTGSHTMEQPWLDEASHMAPYTYNISMHTNTAHEKGLTEGDLVELESNAGRKVTGRLKLMEGIQEKAISIAACSGHWAKGMPIAKGKGTNFNTLMENDLQHTDHICLNLETAVRVKIRKVEGS
jgi:anaerobic selenocysteine-containing dehydrogenase